MVCPLMADVMLPRTYARVAGSNSPRLTHIHELLMIPVAYLRLRGPIFIDLLVMAIGGSALGHSSCCQCVTTLMISEVYFLDNTDACWY